MDLHFVLLEKFVVKLANIEVISDIEDAEVVRLAVAGEKGRRSRVWLLSGNAITLKMTRDEALDAVSQACAAIDTQQAKILRPV
jgi:hypothetical protein|tara:strand:- start:7045 stop:7296 length:252 start_codon:yes stop_codon:yes gene_type:complete